MLKAKKSDLKLYKMDLNLKPKLYFLVLLSGFICVFLQAGGEEVRKTIERVAPGPGIDIHPDKLSQTQARLDEFLRAVHDFEISDGDISGLAPASWVPDLLVFHKAVNVAVMDHQLFSENQWDWVDQVLEMGKERLELLKNRDDSWIYGPGPVVRGYRSQIDQSIQPYVVVLPDGIRSRKNDKRRLDVWLHGRDNQLTELKFIARESKSSGPYDLKDGILLKPYGRYCNAFRFAGEADVLEATLSVERSYSVDPKRRLIRGFSMGGAGCWYLATHYPSFWAGAAPGAGFAETYQYQNFSKKSGNPVPEWEQLLWRWTDATSYAANLTHVPVVAYSGENDSQMQAALIMDSFLAREGIPLKHLVGPGMGHRYHPEVEREIHLSMDRIAERGKNNIPQRVRMTTYSLRYNEQDWVEILELEQHWDRAELEVLADPVGQLINVQSQNVNRFKLDLKSGQSFFEPGRRVVIRVNSQTLLGSAPYSDQSWSAELHKTGNEWKLETNVGHNADSRVVLKKRPGLQGPVDDAFLDGFVFVKPGGPFWTSELESWVKKEISLAELDWRTQMRGEVPVVQDSEVTDEMMQNNHLILWGDPASNAVLGRIHKELPLKWNSSGFALTELNGSVEGAFYPATNAVPVMIFPNPLNPQKYVVLNSGFTFAVAGSMSNSRQTPKLPDFAVLDLNTDPRKRPDTGILEAGFFNENWELDRKLSGRYWGAEEVKHPRWIHLDTVTDQ